MGADVTALCRLCDEDRPLLLSHRAAWASFPEAWARATTLCVARAMRIASCSRGTGCAMSRGEAKRRFTLADHRAATEGVECRKDKDVIDETPAAYKDIDAVMQEQRDLVDLVHTLKQMVCVKGPGTLIEGRSFCGERPPIFGAVGSVLAVLGRFCGPCSLTMQLLRGSGCPCCAPLSRRHQSRAACPSKRR